jgi:hypothetical protein
MDRISTDDGVEAPLALGRGEVRGGEPPVGRPAPRPEDPDVTARLVAHELAISLWLDTRAGER